MSLEKFSLSGHLLVEDDDDYHAGSGTEIFPWNETLWNNSYPSLLPIFEPFKDLVNDSLGTTENVFPNLDLVNASLGTTENPAHNLTTVKGAGTQLKVYDILMPPLGGIALLMNLAVVISSGLILKSDAQPRTTYLFLGNVAMADFISAVTTLFGQFFPRDMRNELICIIQIGMIVSSTLASIWSVLLIGIDRFFFIVHALKYQQRLNPFRARMLILFTWVLGITIGFLPITGWKGSTNNGKYCWFTKLAPSELILTTAIIGCFPIIMIIVLYSIILYHALKKVAQLQKADYEASIKHDHRDNSNTNQLRLFRGGQSLNKNTENSPKRRSPKKFRAIMVVGLTTGTFVVTWVPYLIVSVMFSYCMKSAADPEDCKPLSVALAAPLIILGFLNSLINPLIYAWWHKKFRTFVCNRILRKTRVQQHGNSSTSNSSRWTRKGTSSSNKSNSTTVQSSDSRPTSSSSTNAEVLKTRKMSSGVTEGPYIGENEDTHL